jgi:hypothetical protein
MSDNLIGKIGSFTEVTKTETTNLETPTALPVEPTTPLSPKMFGATDAVESLADQSNVFQTNVISTAGSTDVQPFTKSALIGALDQIAPQLSGAVSSDALLTIKTQALSPTPNFDTIFSSLETLNTDDRVQTLAAFSKEVDVSGLLTKIDTPESQDRFGQFLAGMATEATTEPKTASLLSGFLSDMSAAGPTFGTAIRTFYTSADISALPSGAADDMIGILNANQQSSPNDRLFDLLAMQSIRTEHPLTAFSNFGEPYQITNNEISTHIDNFFADFMHDKINVQAPAMATAFVQFPKFMETKMVQLSDIHLIDQFMTPLMRSGEKLGTALAKVSEDSVNDTALTDALHKALHYLQQYGGPAADDTVREMIQHYDANQAVDQLSKLSPDLLSEMKLILQQGDDTALNQQMLNDFVDPAIAASRTAE